jgi:hypothetical protein
MTHKLRFQHSVWMEFHVLSVGKTQHQVALNQEKNSHYLYGVSAWTIKIKHTIQENLKS